MGFKTKLEAVFIGCTNVAQLAWLGFIDDVKTTLRNVESKE